MANRRGFFHTNPGVLVKLMVREEGSEIYDEDGVDGGDEGFYEGG